MSAPMVPVEDVNRPRSGILMLRNAIADYFAQQDVPAVVAPVGLKYRFFTGYQNDATGGNRICVIPGEFAGEEALKARKFGALSRDTHNTVGTPNPREIAAWDKTITLSIWSPPKPGARDQEGEAMGIAEDLLEQTIRAVVYAEDADGNSVAASIEWGDITIVSPPNEYAFGVEMLVSLTQKGPLLDRALEVVQATFTIDKETTV